MNYVMKESMNNILTENISFSPLWKGKLSQAKLPQAFTSPILKNITCICPDAADDSDIK